jgi:lon-related putative ATP-dependent protease
MKTSLPPDRLFRKCTAEALPFETTAELPDAEPRLGQERARAALEFGTAMQTRGYHIFALGPPGVGKRTLVGEILGRRAAAEPAASDWCYVNNFAASEKPSALPLPAGRAAPFRRDMEKLIEDLRASIPAAFESEDYRARLQALEKEVEERRDQAIQTVQAHARERHLALARTPVGFVVAPVRDGDVLEAEKFDQLPEAERQRIREEMVVIQEEMQAVLRAIPQLERDHREKVKALNREVALYAVGHLIDELRKGYADLPNVLSHIDAVQADILENVHEFIAAATEEADAAGQIRKLLSGAPTVRRYRVNVVVERGDARGAPVVLEDLPTYSNLFGRIEHRAHFGALLTDFTMIHVGALHRANGGYLVLDARKLLLQPFAWQQLKRALASERIRVETLEQLYGFGGTISLEPEPIPLRVKVVLIGDRFLYHLLAAYDPEFLEHFKVAADFEDEISRSGNELAFARLVAALVRREKLRTFARDAVARVVEHASRLASDAEKLSAKIQATVDLVREADQGAAAAGHSVVAREDVQAAIDGQRRRQGRLQERLLEHLLRGTLLIDTSGARVGQVNGLSVIQLGDFAFGHPSRITARVRLGKGEVVDIEREVELGGPIHSKGVLILAGFLAQRFASDRPFALSASLVFEQSYGGVEGDSASSAELYALLSALSDVPIRQDVAVTGSVNQLGQVQAIGGVNEKVEGFFDLCRARGLSGDQGVVIPAANVNNLMLRAEVVDACAAGKFHVWAVEDVDAGMEILTGVPAGVRGADERFPEGSVNARAAARLEQLASVARHFASVPELGRAQP